MIAPRIVVIADDLTGAADSGVAFAGLGLRTLVVWHSDAVPEAEVLVFTSESRHRECGEALRRVQHVARSAATVPGVQDRAWIYKKIDSTLRGHPGPELKAVMSKFGLSQALVAPAFPAQGRTTIDGIHYVNGARLTETVFGQEVPTARVGERIGDAIGAEAVGLLPLALVRQGPDAVAATIQTASGGVFIGDAERAADLDCLASAALRSGIRVFCGSGGLAAALTRVLPAYDSAFYPPRTPGRKPHPQKQGSHALVIAASRHPQTVRQIQFMEAAGVPVVRPEVAWFVADTPVGPHCERWARRLTEGPLVLTSHGLPDLPGESDRIAARLAGAARALSQRVALAGLILTGGDAAISVGRALEAEAMWLRGEVQSGIPWGTLVGGAASGLTVITKAGGFGKDDVLLAAIQVLESSRIEYQA